MKRNAYVYVMATGPDVVKVGHSVDPALRMKVVGGTDLLFTTELIDEVERVERTAHRLLKLSGKHVRGEYFRASLKEAISAIANARRIVDGEELELDKITPVRKKVDKNLLVLLDFSDDVFAILDAMAEAENRSRSNMVETLILRASRKK